MLNVRLYKFNEEDHATKMLTWLEALTLILATGFHSYANHYLAEERDELAAQQEILQANQDTLTHDLANVQQILMDFVHCNPEAFASEEQVKEFFAKCKLKDWTKAHFNFLEEYHNLNISRILLSDILLSYLQEELISRKTLGELTAKQQALLENPAIKDLIVKGAVKIRELLKLTINHPALVNQYLAHATTKIYQLINDHPEFWDDLKILRRRELERLEERLAKDNIYNLLVGEWISIPEIIGLNNKELQFITLADDELLCHCIDAVTNWEEFSIKDAFTRQAFNIY